MTVWPYSKAHQAATERVYLALDRIIAGPGSGPPELGLLAVRALQDALALPPVAALADVDERQFALSVEIVAVNGGCRFVRSSHLLASLGFGNARLTVRARLHDLRDGQPVLTFRRTLRHNGLSRGADEYLEDNGTALIQELSVLAAYRLVQRIHRVFKPSRLRGGKSVRSIQTNEGILRR